MRKIKILRAALITGLLAAASQQAFAATQGTLGATSTGTVLASVTISQQYQISGLTDFALGTYSGAGALTANQDVCAYTNDSTRAYHVLVTDSSTMSATGFSVQNAGATAQIPYTLKWNNAIGTTGNVALAYNTLLAGANANIVSATCTTGGKSANLQINMIATDLQAAPAGSYSTTITMVVEP
jgi:hypothetical protein